MENGLEIFGITERKICNNAKQKLINLWSHRRARLPSRCDRCSRWVARNGDECKKFVGGTTVGVHFCQMMSAM